MTKESYQEEQESKISIHIFTVSATMVGVCLTVIGIINILSFDKKIETIVDDILVSDAILFLAACVISYFAIKTEERQRKLRIERTADFVFLIALGLMALICFSIVMKW